MLVRKHAFTLVEMLVCLSIVGLLLALILPAVQSSRESGRRLECSTRMRELGLAVSNFQAAYNFYPRGVRPDGTSESGWLFAMPEFISVHVELLPFLDQNPLYNGLNLARSPIFSRTPNHDLVANSTLQNTAVTVFLCPSDHRSAIGGTNLRFNVGPNPSMNDGTRWPGGGGPFPGLGTVRPADVTDGLSQTVGLSERSHGSASTSFDRTVDVWYSALSLMRLAVDGDDMQVVCSSLSSKPLSFYGRSGYSWLDGGFQNTLYNHVATSNWVSPDCSPDVYSSNDIAISGGVISARSYHPKGG